MKYPLLYIRNLLTRVLDLKLTGAIRDVGAVHSQVTVGVALISSTTSEVLDEVFNERTRQDEKWGPVQDHPSFVGADLLERAYGHQKDWSYSTKVQAYYGIPSADESKAKCDNRFRSGAGSYADILLEEVCEALAEHDEMDEHKLEVELIQVAAVAVKWVENIRRKRREAGLKGSTIKVSE